MAKAATPGGIYQIDPIGIASYEPPAQVLTLLAFPHHGPPTPALDQRFGEICAFVLRQRAEADAVWAQELQPMRPSHVFISAARAQAVGKKLQTELNRRLTAGRMAIAFLQPDAPLPPGVQRLSLNELAKFAASGSVENTETRDFRPSRPVLHLCIALAWLNLLAARQGLQAGPFDAIIHSAETLRRFLGLAEAFEEPVLAAKGLGVTSLNCIRWTES